MTEPAPGKPDERELPRALAHAAALTGVAILVPVPFLDDWMAERSRSRLVATLLARRGRSVPSARLAPLWVDGGCLSSCLFFPLKLVLWPLKKLFKTIFFVFALRSAALAVGRTLALGRAVDRALERGRLADAPLPAPGLADPLTADARRVRMALDRAYAGSDFVAIRAALEVSLRGIKGLPAAAGDIARRALGRDAPPVPAPAGDGSAATGALVLPPAERTLLDRVVDAILAALRDPSAQKAITDFDRRFDAALAAIDALPPPGSTA